MSAVLSKAGLQAEKQACALADYLNIAIQFEEFSKVGWAARCKGHTELPTTMFWL